MYIFTVTRKSDTYSSSNILIDVVKLSKAWFWKILEITDSPTIDIANYNKRRKEIVAKHYKTDKH